MSATPTRTVTAGALSLLLATAGSALAGAATGIDDLGPVLNAELGQKQVATATRTPEDRTGTSTTNTTGTANTTDTAVQMVSLEEAAAGKAPAYRCKVVTGIRGWRAARLSLQRQGFRRLHVLRFTPRRVTPIARLRGYARCTGGWYVLTASRGAIRYRLAVDGGTLKVAALTRIGADRRRARRAHRANRVRSHRRPVHRLRRQRY
jgi:hypothetical protein